MSTSNGNGFAMPEPHEQKPKPKPKPKRQARFYADFTGADPRRYQDLAPKAGGLDV